MDLYIYHGRLDPNGGATTVTGHPIDDWGFEGPRLKGCIGLHSTYGSLYIHFKDEAACLTAMALTGWARGVQEHDLELQLESGCVKLWNKERKRFEFFGDWGIIRTGPVTQRQ